MPRWKTPSEGSSSRTRVGQRRPARRSPGHSEFGLVRAKHNLEKVMRSSIIPLLNAEVQTEYLLDRMVEYIFLWRGAHG